MATIKALPKPKPLKILTDKNVPGNTTIKPGGTLAGIYQDPGVVGQTIDSFGGIPSLAGLPPLRVAPDSDYTGLPGTTVPGTSGGGGGGSSSNPFDPNAYLNEIYGDPGYKSGLANFTAALGAGRAGLEDQIRRAVLQSGYDPRPGMTGSLLSPWASVVDQATVDAASNDPLTTKGQIQTQLSQGLAGMNASLAARGMLQSGAQAIGGDTLTKQAQAANQQQMASLIDAISGGIGGYNNLETQQNAALNDVFNTVGSRLSQIPGYSGPATGSETTPGATTVPGSTAAPGATAPPAATGPVSWMGKTFTTMAGLDAYLKKTSGGYSNFNAWAQDHKTAAQRLGWTG